jgi:hypothetical protein
MNAVAVSVTVIAFPSGLTVCSGCRRGVGRGSPSWRAALRCGSRGGDPTQHPSLVDSGESILPVLVDGLFLLIARVATSGSGRVQASFHFRGDSSSTNERMITEQPATRRTDS